MILMVILLLSTTPLCVTLGERYTAEGQWHEEDIVEPYENDRLRVSLQNLDELYVEPDDPMKKGSVKTQENVIDIKMPGVQPQQMDTYMCISVELPTTDNYIVKYEPQAEQQVAHHMLLYGCETPFEKPGAPWECMGMHPVCGWGSQTLLYAWAKNAPSLRMPENVGFHIGGSSGNLYLVLQVHYLHVKKFKGPHGKHDHSGVTIRYDAQKKQYLSGISVLAAGGPAIPPRTAKFHINIGCHVTEGPTVTPFRFRTHAHALGSVITGYRVRNGKWEIIGRGDPQRAQAFYKVKHKDMDVKRGDYLIGRCTFNSTSRARWTYFGATHKDEMCNFYMMYYYDSEYGVNDFTCVWDSDIQKFFTDIRYPKCNDVLLADMEHKKCTDSAQ